MSDNKDAPIEGHEYDGIQEFDNPLPMWWLVTFFGTIIFGFLYWLHYDIGNGPNQYMDLKEDMAAIQGVQKSQPASSDSEDDLKKLAAMGEVVQKGKEVFAAKCAACHGAELQGLIGPNLTDEYWIHGQGQLTEVAKVIREGVLDKGMPAWDSQMSKDDVRAVVALIASAMGSNPKDAKPPQGNKIGN